MLVEIASREWPSYLDSEVLSEIARLKKKTNSKGNVLIEVVYQLEN